MQPVTSTVATKLYLLSAVGCVVYKDMNSCQALANLCVLNLYDDQSYSCKLFKQKSSDEAQDDIFPLIYYRKSDVAVSSQSLFFFGEELLNEIFVSH